LSLAGGWKKQKRLGLMQISEILVTNERKRGESAGIVPDQSGIGGAIETSDSTGQKDVF
jgi:hypothetical protein